MSRPLLKALRAAVYFWYFPHSQRAEAVVSCNRASVKEGFSVGVPRSLLSSFRHLYIFCDQTTGTLLKVITLLSSPAMIGAALNSLILLCQQEGIFPL